jgi:hypothetical protein
MGMIRLQRQSGAEGFLSIYRGDQKQYYWTHAYSPVSTTQNYRFLLDLSDFSRLFAIFVDGVVL